MNKAIGEICHRYGLDYWLWLPAEFDLMTPPSGPSCSTNARSCSATARLTGIFFPGGDPGNNPPELVLPFLEDLSRRMLPIHPAARIWLSLQWFTAAQIDYIYQYIEREAPKWFAGLVAGPSSPPAGADAAASPQAVQAAPLPRPHAQQALSVRSSAVGPGLRVHARPGSHQSAPGRIRRASTIATRPTATASSPIRMAFTTT